MRGGERGAVESIKDYFLNLLIHLVREICICQGKVIEFQKPLAVASMARIANEKTGFASSFPRADSAISTLPLYTSVPIEVQCLMQLRVHLKQVSEKNFACICGR